MKILPHYPLVLPSKKVHNPRTFCKTVSHQQQKKKQKKQGGEKDEILLSAHARTSKGVIWHQERKLV